MTDPYPSGDPSTTPPAAPPYGASAPSPYGRPAPAPSAAGAPSYGAPAPAPYGAAQQPYGQAPAYAQDPAYTQPPAYAQAPVYGQPYAQAQAYGYGTAPKTNALAIVSLVASISAFVILPIIGSIVGIITGHMSLGQIKTSGESGRGLALAGTIVGWVSVGLGILVVLLIFAAWIPFASSVRYP